jgi:hypothetical protein
MRACLPALALGLILAGTGAATAQPATGSERRGPPHDWAFGVWTGGLFPAGNPDPEVCLANATVIILRDVVLRASALDVSFRQRVIETVARTTDGQVIEFRLVPAAPVGSAFGLRVPPDAGFGCDGGPDVLRAERRGADEMVFPGCREFLSPLKRCGVAGR